MDNYPALTSFRLSDGSWGLENAHVIMKQLESIDTSEEDLPLVSSYSA